MGNWCWSLTLQNSRLENYRRVVILTKTYEVAGEKTISPQERKSVNCEKVPSRGRAGPDKDQECAFRIVTKIFRNDLRG